jgi:type IV pilus assembly protein PilX
MNKQTLHPHGFERGMALISSLLLLLVMTILGIAMFRTFGMQERIAGNTRDRQRAVHTADTAETYGEWWLTRNGALNATQGTQCDGTAAMPTTTPLVCSNILSNTVADVTTVPWQNGAAYLGVGYTPPGLQTNAGTKDAYYQPPTFYISFVSGTYDTNTKVTTNAYTIDATGYGGTVNAVAVVEGAYVVSKVPSTTGKNTLFQDQGGK